jgi:hypothetical protein
MRRLGKFGLILALVISGIVVSYKIAYPTYTHRFRLTIAIDVDGTVHRDSTVMEVRWIGQPRFGDAPPFFPFFWGQAPLIDLGSRGAIAVALHPGTVEGRFMSAKYLATNAFGLGHDSDAYRKIAEQSGRRELSADNMPMLIHFRDISDPATAQATTAGHIGWLFGPTARLAEASVEITHQPVVIDLDRRLPWYAAMAARQKDGRDNITMPGQFKLIYNMLIAEGT